MQPLRRLAGALTGQLRRRRAESRHARDLDIEISHDVAWAHYRRERVPLCIATKHLRS